MLTILLFLHFIVTIWEFNYISQKKKKKYSLSRMKNKSLENLRFVLSEIISSMIKFQRYRTKVKFF